MWIPLRYRSHGPTDNLR